MTHTEALITAARRYLMQNFSFWAERYSKERTGNDFPYTYTDNDYDLFPRYNVLSAMLQEVETLVGQKNTTADACKVELMNIGLIANSVLTTGDQNQISLNAMQEERHKFVAFIENISAEALDMVAPPCHIGVD